ncbi:MAG: peptidase M23 [Cytophagales bacterium]|nr:MAG: peptidase M23 [Cytophagales bacterium]
MENLFPDNETLTAALLEVQESVARVVPIHFQKDRYIWFDFSVHNHSLLNVDLSSPEKMQAYISAALSDAQAKVGLGGYNEERAVYQRSAVFDTQEGLSRSIHLGIDIWMPAQTPIYTPLQAKVHSFQDNAHMGDYGPTIILEHNLKNKTFYTLYGHLSRESLQNLYEGKSFEAGDCIATLGDVHENGQWATHLHFQIIRDLLGKKGDFFGVAPKIERDFYLSICPDPEVLLKL